MGKGPNIRVFEGTHKRIPKHRFGKSAKVTGNHRKHKKRTYSHDYAIPDTVSE